MEPYQVLPTGVPFPTQCPHAKPEPVAKMNGGEKVVACVPFRKVAEDDYHDFTSVIVRDSQGTLRTMEVRGSVKLDDFPDGLVHSPA